MATTEVEEGTDVLAFAPRPVNRRLITALALLVALALLAVAGVVVWRRLQPPPDFTLAQLEGAYTGMVRSDGTNDVSTIDPSKFTDPPLAFTPAGCARLFDTTVANQWPAGALDGVSTYWLNDGTASISLFTVRYADDDAAKAAYQQVVDARPGCEGSITFSASSSTDRRLPESGGTGPNRLPARAGGQPGSLRRAPAPALQHGELAVPLRLRHQPVRQHRRPAADERPRHPAALGAGGGRRLRQARRVRAAG
jgi:hypothetical protein